MLLKSILLVAFVNLSINCTYWKILCQQQTLSLQVLQMLMSKGCVRRRTSVTRRTPQHHPTSANTMRFGHMMKQAVARRGVSGLLKTAHLLDGLWILQESQLKPSAKGFHIHLFCSIYLHLLPANEF